MSSAKLLSTLITVFYIGLAGLPAWGFDSKPWLDDLDQTREAFATKYANFSWAVFQREIDLSKIFSETRERIVKAQSAADAKAAFDRLTKHLGDGHVEFEWPTEPSPIDLEAVRSKAAEPPSNLCEAEGYDASSFGASLAGHMQGYRSLDHVVPEFPAGTIMINGRKIGVIKIGLFSPHGIPTLCAAALKALRIAPSATCDDNCSNELDDWANTRMTSDLADTVAAVRKAGAQTLLIDIAQNGGGSEWAEAAARMVTRIRLRSERLGFVRGEHWIKKWRNLAADLRKAESTAAPSDQGRLANWAREADDKAVAAATPCSSEPFWQGTEPNCAWLGEGAFATGLVGAADIEQLRDKPWASLVFSPAEFPYHEGVWRGPLIVLVDGETWSAAEEFASILQDNRAAVVIGVPTGGAGCGHTDGGTPSTLTHSSGILKLPDCARFRANGDNEIAGVQPDVLVGLRRHDGPDRQARFLKAKLPEADRLAQALTH